MERYRLKAIIILILLLVDGFLGFYLLRRDYEERQSRRRTEESLTALFAADGIALDPSALSRDLAPEPVRLPRDEQMEAEAAAFFLGEGASFTRRGGTNIYTIGAASARFRLDGTFSISGIAVSDGAERLCRRFCRKWSFDPPVFSGTPDGTVTAAARYGNLPVVNCLAAFRFEQGTLREVSGTLLPEKGTALDTGGASAGTSDRTGSLLTSAGALAAFQAVWREEHVVASSVSETSLCWSLRTDAQELDLIPMWRIAADTVNYYVDCVSGSVYAE